jgi:hypothetical protein
MFLYFVKKVKGKLEKEGDKKEEELLDKNKKTGLYRSLQLVDIDEKMKILVAVEPAIIGVPTYTLLHRPYL